MAIKALCFGISLLCSSAQIFSGGPSSDGYKPHTRVQNCFTSVCPDLADEPGFREKEAIHEISGSSKEEVLRLNINDPREKLLYFRAEADFNGALNARANSEILNAFHENFDMKYAVVQSYPEICEEIQEAAKTGKLKNVVIDAHGLPDSIKLSKGQLINRSAIAASPSCFSGLEPSGTIFLFSCCTGASGDVRDKVCFRPGIPLDPNYQPFAQAMADQTERRVIAAESAVYGTETRIISLNPLMVFHKDTRDTNLFKVFTPFAHPDYKTMTSIAAEALKSTDPLIRDYGLDLFQELFDQGQGFDPAIDVVIEMLKSTDPGTRRSAFHLLGKLVGNGYGFKIATGASIELFNSADREIRAIGLDLFRRLFDQEQGFEAAIDVATQAFQSEDLEILMDGRDLFGKLFDKGQGFKAAISATSKACKSANFWVRAAALDLVEKLGESDQFCGDARSGATETLKSTESS